MSECSHPHPFPLPSRERGNVVTEENQLLKAQIFHANSVEKLPKIHEQFNNLLAHLEKDDIVSVNTTEISLSLIHI